MSKIRKKIQLFLINRKTITFSVCLLLAIFLWFSIRFSKILQQEFVINVSVQHTPKGMFLSPSEKIPIKIVAEGKLYDLFSFFSKNQLNSIDFNDLEYLGDKKYKLSKNIANKFSIPSSLHLKIIHSYSDTLFLNLVKKHTKKIPVKASFSAVYPKDFQLTALSVSPDSVTVVGEKKAIDTIAFYPILHHTDKELSGSFSVSYEVKNTTYATYQEPKVTLNATISKVSENLIEVPVSLVNIPEHYRLKIFPQSVMVVCLGSISDLKNITPESIKVEADFNQTKKDNFLYLTIKSEIKSVRFSFLNDDKVAFLLAEKQ